MARLGHTTPNMAMRYQHATRERDRAISDRLGAPMRAAELLLGEGPKCGRYARGEHPLFNVGSTLDMCKAVSDTFSLVFELAPGGVLRGEGSNLQHPAPKADVLPIELPRKKHAGGTVGARVRTIG